MGGGMTFRGGVERTFSRRRFFVQPYVVKGVRRGGRFRFGNECDLKNDGELVIVQGMYDSESVIAPLSILLPLSVKICIPKV